MTSLLRGQPPLHLRPIYTKRLYPFPPAPTPASIRNVATSPIAMTPRIMDAVMHDHREIEALFDRILSSPNEDDKVRFQNQFTWELARHAIGEELVVYPAFEKYVSGGVEMANKDRKEHQTVKEQLKTFQNMSPSDAHFEPTLKALMKDLSQHIKEEETHDLPMLEQALTKEESESFSKSLGRTKMFVPSRAHPSAPDKPPFETAVGLLAAPIDHLADLFRKWPETAGMLNPSSK